MTPEQRRRKLAESLAGLPSGFGDVSEASMAGQMPEIADGFSQPMMDDSGMVPDYSDMMERGQKPKNPGYLELARKFFSDDPTLRGMGQTAMDAVVPMAMGDSPVMQAASGDVTGALGSNLYDMGNYATLGGMDAYNKGQSFPEYLEGAGKAAIAGPGLMVSPLLPDEMQDGIQSWASENEPVSMLSSLATGGPMLRAGGAMAGAAMRAPRAMGPMAAGTGVAGMSTATETIGASGEVIDTAVLDPRPGEAPAAYAARIRELQTTIGAGADGVAGPGTRRALQSYNERMSREAAEAARSAASADERKRQLEMEVEREKALSSSPEAMARAEAMKSQSETERMRAQQALELEKAQRHAAMEIERRDNINKRLMEDREALGISGEKSTLEQLRGPLAFGAGVTAGALARGGANAATWGRGQRFARSLRGAGDEARLARQEFSDATQGFATLPTNASGGRMQAAQARLDGSANRLKGVGSVPTQLPPDKAFGSLETAALAGTGVEISAATAGAAVFKQQMDEALSRYNETGDRMALAEHQTASENYQMSLDLMKFGTGFVPGFFGLGKAVPKGKLEPVDPKPSLFDRTLRPRVFEADEAAYARGGVTGDVAAIKSAREMASGYQSTRDELAAALAARSSRGRGSSADPKATGQQRKLPPPDDTKGRGRPPPDQPDDRASKGSKNNTRGGQYNDRESEKVRGAVASLLSSGGKLSKMSVDDIEKIVNVGSKKSVPKDRLKQLLENTKDYWKKQRREPSGDELMSMPWTRAGDGAKRKTRDFLSGAGAVGTGAAAAGMMASPDEAASAPVDEETIRRRRELARMLASGYGI